MNKVELFGRVTRDVEYKRAGESGFARFTVAVDRPKRKGEEKAEADFITCVAWGKAGEVIAKYFAKGRQIALDGRLRTGSYEDKDGKKVYTTEVWVDNFDFVDSAKPKAQETSGSTPFVDFGEEVPF